MLGVYNHNGNAKQIDIKIKLIGIHEHDTYLSNIVFQCQFQKKKKNAVIKYENRTADLTSILNFCQLSSSWISEQDIVFNDSSNFWH